MKKNKPILLLFYFLSNNHPVTVGLYAGWELEFRLLITVAD